jgi:hypothetical protein
MMAVLWSFRCYRSDNGTDEVRAWYESGSKQLQARFLSRLKTLAQQARNEWHGNWYKPLHGECDGLGEIRFIADKVQQRPLGFRSGDYEFTILLCVKEKGGKFVPLGACKKALARRDEILKDRSRTNALWLVLE